jgi:hypothetical protein
MRAQVDMKIVYLALSLVIIGIFVNLIWPMMESAVRTSNETFQDLNKTMNK